VRDEQGEREQRSEKRRTLAKTTQRNVANTMTPSLSASAHPSSLINVANDVPKGFPVSIQCLVKVLIAPKNTINQKSTQNPLNGSCDDVVLCRSKWEIRGVKWVRFERRVLTLEAERPFTGMGLRVI
jgi:hypothetical protein